jgi:hypothetical protein
MPTPAQSVLTVNHDFKKLSLMSLFDQISEDIKAAMLAKDKVRLSALRNVKKLF